MQSPNSNLQPFLSFILLIGIISLMFSCKKTSSTDVVAHDIGGGVAQLIAVNYPEKIRKLVLMDSMLRLVARSRIPATTENYENLRHSCFLVNADITGYRT